MAVLRFVVRRVAALAAMLVVLSFLVFALLYLAPGDLVRNLLGARAVTPRAEAAIRAQYHLDEPFWVQYARWLGGALHGDFGTSVRTGTPVSQMLDGRIGVTVTLAVIAGVLAVGIGVPLGIRAARRRGSAQDQAITSASVVGISAPGFAVGLVLLYVFAVMLGWFPLYGVGDPGLDRLWHLALPAVALAVGVGALVVKVTRTAVLRELDQDYVTFARSRGLSGRKVLRMYLRGAAVPIVTSTGLVLASLIGGSILVETTFALPGLGVLLSDSITFKDVPVVQAVTLLLAAFIGITTAVVDLFAILADPRVRRTKVTR